MLSRYLVHPMDAFVRSSIGPQWTVFRLTSKRNCICPYPSYGPHTDINGRDIEQSRGTMARRGRARFGKGLSAEHETASVLEQSS